MKPLVVPPDYKPVQGVGESSPPTAVYNYSCCAIHLHGEALPDETKRGRGTPQRTRRRPASITSAMLSMAQILCGVILFSAQIAPTYWSMFLLKTKDVNIDLRWWIFDHVAAGTWSGIYILITGIVGLVACRRNTTCSILAHMMLNGFAFLFAVTVIGLAATNLSSLVDCKNSGSSVDVNNAVDWMYYHDDSDFVDEDGVSHVRTTAVPAVVDVLGEKFTLYTINQDPRQQFYCENSLFMHWIVLESLMIAASLVTIASTIWLLILNSKAVCSCCMNCCSATDDKDIALISAGHI